MRAHHILALIVSVCVAGCIGSPNNLEVSKVGIKAYGRISGVFKKRDRIEVIQIDPRALSGEQAHDLWVGFAPTNQMTIADITEEVTQGIGVHSTNYYSAAGPHDYIACGYALSFSEGQLVSFHATHHGFPPSYESRFVQLGSRKSGSSLSFPCTVDDFEKVFGKADKIRRDFAW